MRIKIVFISFILNQGNDYDYLEMGQRLEKGEMNICRPVHLSTHLGSEVVVQEKEGLSPSGTDPFLSVLDFVFEK